MDKQDDFILVFDSGIGGISVLRELVKRMPAERFLYFGDSQRAPYGTRPTQEVRALTLARIGSLMRRGIKAVVVACNTATAAAIEELRAAYPGMIIVGMEPAIKLAAERHGGGRILVMATNVTLRERKFCDLMNRFSQTCQITPLPCPGLVEQVEAGHLHTPQIYSLLEALLAPALSEKPDAIVLGCTHYPFLRPAIQEIVGPEVEILDGGAGTARETLRRLQAAGLQRRGKAGSVELQNSLESRDILAMSARLLEHA